MVSKKFRVLLYSRGLTGFTGQLKLDLADWPDNEEEQQRVIAAGYASPIVAVRRAGKVATNTAAS
jgi:hypothetical protein